MNIINTPWWQAIGAFLFIGLIVVCIYNLWDLKREQQAADDEAEAINKAKQESKIATKIYLKPAHYIYPKTEDGAVKTSSRPI